jgi:signal transduction histidine kinase/ligand-binding sensor domain-containing protein
MNLYKFSKIARWFFLLLFSLIGLCLKAQQLDIGAVKTEYAQFFFEELSTRNGLLSNYVTSLFRDSRDNLWIATDKGVSCFDGLRFKHFTMQDGLLNSYVNQISEDARGRIWFMNESRLIYLENNVLHVYPEPATGTRLERQNEALYLLKRVRPHHKLDVEKTVFKPSNDSIAAFGRDLLFENKLLSAKLPSPENIFFAKKVQNYWFVSINGLGITRIDSLANTLLLNKARGMKSNIVTDMIQMPDGTILFSTLGAGIQIWRNSEACFFPLSNEKVLRITTTENPKTVFASADTDVFEISDLNGAQTARKILSSSSSISALDIHGKSTDKILAVGSLGKIYLLKSQKDGYGFQKKAEIINTAGTSGFRFTKPTAFWVSTYGGGFYNYKFSDRRIQLQSQAVIQANLAIVEKIQPLRNNTFALFTLSHGVFIATESVSTSRRDSLQILAHLNTKNGLPDNATFTCFQEADSLWIGTSKGVSWFINGQISKQFDAKNGFEGKQVVAIFRDADQKLWVVSDRALHWVHGDALQIIHTTPLHIFLKGKNLLSILSARYEETTNKLWIGTDQNLCAINMREVVPFDWVSAPKLTHVSADSLVFTPENTLIFSYKTQKLAFLFQKPSLSTATCGRVFYRILGFADAWQLVPENLFSLEITKMPAGKYVLESYAQNPDGVKSAVVELCTFEITPAWWQTIWAKMGLILGLVSLASWRVWRWGETRRQRQSREIALLQQIQEERERISRDLHDNVGARLTHLVGQIDNIEIRLTRDNSEQAVKLALNKLETLGDNTRQTIDILRETIWVVKTEAITLEDFKNRIVQYFQQHLSDQIEFEVQLHLKNTQEVKPLFAQQALNLFRIVQEACQNTLKHAQATQINVHIESQNKGVSISVSDNGNGFDVSNTRHFQENHGLKNMQTRAAEIGAQLEIKTKIGQGTTLLVELENANNT